MISFTHKGDGETRDPRVYSSEACRLPQCGTNHSAAQCQSTVSYNAADTLQQNTGFLPISQMELSFSFLLPSPTGPVFEAKWPEMRTVTKHFPVVHYTLGQCLYVLWHATSENVVHEKHGTDTG